MNHRSSAETRELAALYALGSLDGEELRAFESHLAEGCAWCQTELEGFLSVVDQLGHGGKTIAPPAALREKLMSRVKNEKNERDNKGKEVSPAQGGLTFIRSAEHQWQEILPGILLKQLFMDQDQGRMAALIKMNPETNYDTHRHTAPEEVYVLEGTCFCGGRLLYPGDYHRAERGSIHYETSTQDGCVMFVIFSPNNEMLNPAQTGH